MTILTQAIARLLLAPTLVVAVAVLIKGYAGTGDGFSAGVIAAFGVILQCIAFGYHQVEQALPLRIAPFTAIIGLLIALGVVFGPTLRGRAIIAHEPAPYEEVVTLGTLELHTAVLFDIGVFLLVFGFIISVIDVVADQTKHNKL